MAETTPDLVPVHGGLAAPVNRSVPLSERADFLRRAAELPAVQVARADISTVYRIADGALSPLTGPMRAAQYNLALEQKVVQSEGGRYAWTIPLALPLSDAEAQAVQKAGAAALQNEAGQIVAAVEDAEVFAWDKARYVREVYGTQRSDHPGARIATADARTQLLGGELRALPQPAHPEYGAYMLSPVEVRARIRARQWRAALAFQTRNPLHRAHEYALVAGAETLTAAGLFTGVVLNPLVGELKGDDVPAAARMRCYRRLHSRGLLGQGDCDPQIWRRAGYELHEVFELIGLDIKMFYGGPAEAIMHAVYRQNYGFSHLVIGRKHADAPYDDGSAIWGDFDAQQIFENPPGELHLQPVNIGFAAFYPSLGRVDLMSRHPDEKPYSISGTQVRAQLQAGERPDPRILRPEIAELLIDAYKGK